MATHQMITLDLNLFNPEQLTQFANAIADAMDCCADALDQDVAPTTDLTWRNLDAQFRTVCTELELHGIEPSTCVYCPRD